VLESTTVIFCIFTFHPLVQKCQTLSQFEDAMLSIKKAGEMNSVNLELAAVKGTRAVVWVSGLQTIIWVNCSKIHVPNYLKGNR
jgi:hypothetical protein